jgi:hypothetical protein
MIVGNGLSIDRAVAAGLSVNLNSPFEWPIPNPGTSTPLIDALPALRTWLDSERTAYPDRSHFQHISALLAGSKNAPQPGELLGSGAGFEVHCELRHYLALSYAWFQRQLDQRQMLESWAWFKWLERNRLNLRVALSFNYDLVLERALLRARCPYFYAGTGVRGQKGIAICKPHGSCNFASTLEIQPADENGNVLPLGYPLGTYSWGVDGADVEIIPDAKLSEARGTVDIVAPGEWSMLRGINWVENSHAEFTGAARNCDTLLITGFSYGECDRTEFDQLITWSLPFKRVIVADPNPSAELLSMLHRGGMDLEIWKDGPKPLGRF